MLLQTMGQSEEILNYFISEKRAGNSAILSAGDGDINIAQDILIVTSPVIRRVLQDYPPCMTPHVIIPDVNLKTIHNFKNVFTNVIPVGFDEKQKSDLEDFFNIIHFDKTILTYQENLSPVMNLDPDYSIEYLMKEESETGLSLNLDELTGTEMPNSAATFHKASDVPRINEELLKQGLNKEEKNKPKNTDTENDLDAFLEEIDSLINESKETKFEVETKVELEPLRETNLPTSEYYCDICEKQYELKTQLKSCYTRHSYKHLKIMFSDFVNKKTKSCNLCNKIFKTEKRVFMHIGIKHNKIEEIINTPKSKYLKDENDEEITVTAVKSKNTKQRRNIIELDEENLTLHCQFCNEKTSELSSLLEHLKEHVQVLKSKDVIVHCAVEECDQRFDYKLISKKQNIYKQLQLTHLEEHIRAKHTKTTNINCNECAKQFFSPMGLKYHRRQHMDKSKFYCYKCEHFIHSTIYEKHRNNSNCAKSDSYRCAICSKGFSMLSYLDNHQKIHSSVKKYQCTFCAKSFHQKGNLKQDFL